MPVYIQHQMWRVFVSRRFWKFVILAEATAIHTHTHTHTHTKGWAVKSVKALVGSGRSKVTLQKLPSLHSVSSTSDTETRLPLWCHGALQRFSRWTKILSNSHFHHIAISARQWDESTTLVITHSRRESWRLLTAALLYGGIFRLRCENAARI